MFATFDHAHSNPKPTCTAGDVPLAGFQRDLNSRALAGLEGRNGDPRAVSKQERAIGKVFRAEVIKRPDELFKDGRTARLAQGDDNDAVVRIVQMRNRVEEVPIGGVEQGFPDLRFREDFGIRNAFPGSSTEIETPVSTMFEQLCRCLGKVFVEEELHGAASYGASW